MEKLIAAAVPRLEARVRLQVGEPGAVEAARHREPLQVLLRGEAVRQGGQGGAATDLANRRKELF